ncbi:MAG: nuclear transport factor 2 family protein [Ginsengibacter sp.]
MKRTIFLSLLFFAAINTFSQSSNEEKVLQRVKQLNDAIFVNKDKTALEGLMADKVTYGHSTAKLEDRTMMIDGAVGSKQVYTNFIMDSATVFFERGKTAIVRHVLKAVSTLDGKETPLHLNVLQVWVKQKGQWKLMARQAVKL